MKCPHCEREIAGITCPECGVVTPEGGRFCMGCGVALVQETAEIHETEDDVDFENRILCPDGTCTGIIVNGKCTECEQIYEG